MNYLTPHDIGAMAATLTHSQGMQFLVFKRLSTAKNLQSAPPDTRDRYLASRQLDGEALRRQSA
jgi:hypothetical protein